MNTQKATYWFALGIFALAFTSEYQRGAFPVIHRAATSTGSTFCRLAANAERTFAMARLIVVRPTVSADDLLASEARQLAETRQAAEDQAAMMREEAHDQARMARAEARDQADLLRDRIREQVRAQQEMIRAEVELQRAQIERSQLQRPRAAMRLNTRAQVRVRDFANERVIVGSSGACAQSGVRVAVASMTGLPDDDHDSF